MRRTAHFLLTGCLSAACSASPAPSSGQAPSAPVGAQAQASGFWTVERVPDSPGAPRVEPPKQTLTIYAQIAGVSNEEAEKRVREQEKIRPEIERLMAALRSKERGNYTEAELIHRPDWAYLLYFKRSPAATLAKYSKNPRFQARSAPYTEAELQSLIKPWIDRLSAERLFTGFGLNTRQGRADIDMVVSEDEFRAIAQRKGWEKPPEYINLKFDGAPVGPDVDPSAAKGVRIFPHGDRNLGLTNEAGFGGRIVLRDGCFFVIGLDRTERLAYFAREVGLGLDGQGYLSLHRRTAERQHLGRVGEMFSWPGPIHIDDSAPMVKELRAQCGKAPLMHVGIPESSALFNARYGLPGAPDAPPRRADIPG